MYPALAFPSDPNLVTCLMDDRMAEAAEGRRIAEVPAEPGTSHRFRRFVTHEARSASQASRPISIAEGP